ncbi:SusC/RagA family TonB-linked outer membrane protein [Chitinophaga pendula]|uniref:SusC/RagA family TonB-linked outer membrane protein n=1 Tax=Chitinophaga TaxID=79328 RepID=UPI000BAF0EC4|nr:MULTISPECIES: SusC/RagA family TonB-linked outer membrane protein [Chitinophaga]ASZ11492.1 SusC/RagA family TonB-linked outer membrane protein [Chitinophaga sp. MD30]UCJ05498.1 SusC/RagA family TonB-linked outer membrane protein [Chitinophaga pendula]
MRTLRRSLLLFTLLYFCCCITALAQNKTVVAGIVKDEKGTPLPGVTVKEKGTANGAMTTAEGTYKVSVAPNATLVLSFVGYVMQEIPVNGQSTVNVTLLEDKKNLNEVVVTALGIKREQRKLGYAVTELKGAEVAKTNSINPVAALQGKVAGVDISGAAGGPQAANRIVLRGAKSLNGKDQPIFVIDGVIFENEVSAADVNFGNVLKNFNPDDFESVTVLKGAAATALYGSRAINGAILITTKKGTTRKGLGVNLSQTVQFEHAYRQPIALQNSYGAGRFGTFKPNTTNELDWVGGLSFGPKMDGKMVKLPNGEEVAYSPKSSNALDGYQLGKYFNTNVSMEGGNDKATFRFSYSRLDNNSVSPDNKFSRNSFALKSTAQISKVFSLDGGVNYATSIARNPNRQGGDYTNLNIGRKWIYVFPRNYDPDYWEKRYLTPANARADLAQNPGADYWFALKNYTWERDERLLSANLALTATTTDWLKFIVKGNFSNEQNTDRRKEVGTLANFSGPDGLFALQTVNRSQHTFTGMAMLTPKLGGEFEGSLNLGVETWNSGIGTQMENRTQGGLRIPKMFAISNSVNNPVSKETPLLRKRINSAFFAASLAYKNAFFLDITGRNDWSSALTYKNGTGTNSYFYPSFSGAWEFTQSLKNSIPSFISYGKLRASYAMVGGDTDPFEINPGYLTEGFWNSSSTGQGLPQINMFNQNTLPNLHLKPSISRSFEVGADIRFFNNRIGIDVAWYKSNITNQIIKLPTSMETGVKERYINAGSMQNTGIEVAINASAIQHKNFTWDITLNGSRNRNKIKSLAPGVNQIELNNDQDVRVLAAVGQAYGVIVTDYGFTPYQAKDASGNPVAHPNNGKPVISATGSELPYKYNRGYQVVGNITPDFNLGLSNNFTYKNWSLGFLVQARIGGDIFSASHQFGTGRGTVESTMHGRDAANGGITYTDANGKTRDDGMIPDGVFQDGYKISKNGQEINLGGMTYREAYDKGYVTPMTPYGYYGMQGDWGIGIRSTSVFDASYVALREVSLGYTLPSNVTQRWKMNSLRVMLVGRNLGYLYNNLPDRLNPESIRNNSTSAFSEYGAVPFVRNMAFTVQVGF